MMPTPPAGTGARRRPASRIGDAIDERLDVRRPLARFLTKPVPEGLTFGYCFGGLAFFTFLVLAVTGVALAFFYVPSPDHARASLAWLGSSVPLGAVLRSLHRWSAYAMVVLVVAHMVRVFAHGAYRKPRELNWIVGVLMLLIVLAFGFTGYLLPWDQKAYWATSVGINMAGSVPVVGPFLADLLRGGPNVGALTLLRFYAAHVFVLPALLAVGLVLHFAMVRRQGISEPL
jgi:quinol-cytochrome oxidoreductase complex cytochrome b subunit